MNLNNENLKAIIRLTNLKIVNPQQLSPKVLQFGTGVLLRGLPDYYIDQANRLGSFNGSIILIKSTLQGDATVFERQNNLYTIKIQGIENGQLIQKQQINSSICKVLTVQNDWNEILQQSENPEIQIIISNTTESGIIEIDENLNEIPQSYPGRLAALLYHRYNYFNQNKGKGFIILPTELIDKNADKLKAIVLSIVAKNNLPKEFIHWIESENYFCNTLVDRIVPGKVDTSSWHYRDDLAIAVEPFNMWAIETKVPKLKNKIPFASNNPGIKLVDSIELMKELKLRLLNATHTLTCHISILAKYKLVNETFNDLKLESWVKKLMLTEIKFHLMKVNLEEREIDNFIKAVIDRFKNPFINHQWISIAQNSTQKWKQRVFPILQSWDCYHPMSSSAIALSLACYLKYHEIDKKNEFDKDSQIQRAIDKNQSITQILNNDSIWGIDLSVNKNFVKKVDDYYQALELKSIFQLI